MLGTVQSLSTSSYPVPCRQLFDGSPRQLSSGQIRIQELFIPVAFQQELSQIKQLIMLCFFFIKKELCNERIEALLFSNPIVSNILSPNTIFSFKRPHGSSAFLLPFLKSHQHKWCNIWCVHLHLHFSSTFSGRMHRSRSHYLFIKLSSSLCSSYHSK